MSLFSATISTLLSGKVLNTLKYKNLSKRFIKSYFKDNSVAFFNDGFIKPANMIEHTTQSFDGEELYAYSITHNQSASYIIYVFGYDQNFDDLREISLKFEENGFNSIFIKNRKSVSLGLKESIDLLVWIDYFSNLFSQSNFILFGEKAGAFTVCKSLSSDMNERVKKVVLDDLKSTLYDDLLRQYCIENDIENSLIMAINVNIELNKSMSIDASEFCLKNSIKTNKISVCFIQSKLKNQYEHKELLKVFNETQGEKKIFYTTTLDRNFKQENYFEVVKKHIES